MPERAEVRRRGENLTEKNSNNNREDRGREIASCQDGQGCPEG